MRVPRCARAWRVYGFRCMVIGFALTLSATAFADDTNGPLPSSDEPDPAERDADSETPDATDSELTMPAMHGAAEGVTKSDAVPASTIEVSVLDPRSNAVAGARVGLVRERHSVAQGDAQSITQLSTDAAGKARFEHLDTGSGARYRIVLGDDGTRYGTNPFSMDRTAGAKVVLHAYPVVRTWKESIIVGRSFVFIEPRDQVLSVEYIHEFQNLGQTVLAADTVALDLPEAWKAFATNPTDPDLTVVSTSTGVRLAGAIAPGRHNIAFTFQIPNENRERMELNLGFWPNTAEAQVATLGRPGLELAVDGFPSATLREGSARQPLRWTGRSFAQDASAPTNLRVELSGLPTAGPGRWVATGLAALLALGSLLARLFRREQRIGESGAASTGLQAQERIVDELAALTKAHLQGQIGDTAFADTREVLLAAFVRAARETTQPVRSA